MCAQAARRVRMAEVLAAGPPLVRIGGALPRLRVRGSLGPHRLVTRRHLDMDVKETQRDRRRRIPPYL